MKKKLLLLMIITTSLFAINDADMDGVSDQNDKCPNTPFMDLVNHDGCTKKSLLSPHHYDIVLGANYANSNYNTQNQFDTYSSSLQLDYFYKNFSLQTSLAYFKSTNDSGMYDTYVGASYKLKPLKNLSVRFGAGVVLPTYSSSLNNNNTDYYSSVSITYTINDFTLSSAYRFTLINDDNIDNNTTTLTYQNTNSYNIGLGYYPTQNLYISTTYNNSQSIYANSSNLENISLYGYYSISKHYFTTLSYAYGLSDTSSDNSLSLRIGYYF